VKKRPMLLAVGGLVSGLAAGVSSGALADEVLIRETEALRDTLLLSDPSRLPLTLRLADLCMEDAASADFARKSSLQRRALVLYDEALSSAGQAKIEGTARLRVEFQKARLLTDLGEMDRALPLWTKIASQRELPELAREAALKLAEAGDVGRAAHWYSVALELCSGGDLCSYVRYKRAWLFKQSSGTGLADEKAVAEIELALFDSKGGVREEALRDYLVFLGEMPGADALSALAKVESLAQKLGRPQLVPELAEAFYAAGNKAAGTVVLAQAQRKQPGFARLCRLSEEQYGARDWDAFRVTLEELSGPRGASLMAQAADTEKTEAEKLLRRLVIQLDGERISQPARVRDFQQAALAYLSLFPASPEKAKFQEGWLASEADVTAKLSQLDRWIKAEPTASALGIRLREFKAQTAQKAGMNELLAAEMAGLAALTGSREHRYQQARALYEGKNYSKALPLFTALARTESSPDQWAVQSQNLALDILAMDKSALGLGRVVEQASSWLDAAWAAAKPGLKPELSRELSEMSRIRDEARFEQVVALGREPLGRPDALARFVAFCREGFFAAKSCENARVMSVELKDQPRLVEVLGLLAAKGDPARRAELASELERSGEFARAADLLEKSGPAGLQEALKLALLRELSGDREAWGRSVRKLLDGRQRFKLSAEQALLQEKLWLSMARDSGVLDFGWLKALSTEGARALAAEWLEQSGRGTDETRRVLLSARLMTGPSWQRYVLAELDADVDAQKKISFYGRNSKTQFERRIKAVSALAGRVDGWIARSDEATRGTMAARMQAVFEGLAREIRESPIPDGVPAEAIPELKAGLEQMALPFDEKARVYASAVGRVSDSVVTQSAHAGPAAQPQASEFKAQVSRLARDPDSAEVLSGLRDIYRSLKNERLASYFEGRLQAGQNGGSAQ
jgi:hypothetical protein